MVRSSVVFHCFFFPKADSTQATIFKYNSRIDLAIQRPALNRPVVKSRTMWLYQPFPRCVCKCKVGFLAEGKINTLFALKIAICCLLHFPKPLHLISLNLKIKMVLMMLQLILRVIHIGLLCNSYRNYL